ncbi:FG-GAP repeat domain-containing protein [Sediminibacterium soli]|uniref:FG-GAP repeat domain-containing protein n=1 Tax=Sediminibacterium soli TaxID=2698829 RepID=UPI00137B13C6|nr:VCBS repeat-containing protein [Sediminibacterium soli]NCI47115.1 VCBS repeat-containing protein [Sediminibacterium soli]
MKNRPAFNSTAILIMVIGGLSLFSCKPAIRKNQSHKDVPDERIEKGKQLAITYCQSCHLLPDPSELDSKTWETGALPAMGPRLGIFSYGFARYPSYKTDKDLPANFYPDKPVISNDDWQHIIDYYTSVSPDSLPKAKRQPIRPDLGLFAVQTPALNYPAAGICLTKLDTTATSRQLFLFDLVAQKMFRYDHQLQLLDTFRSDATITDVDFHGNDLLACNVNIINPNNGKYGKGQLIRKNAGGRLSLDTKPLFDSLARPVQMVSCDLNNDGRTDYLVCEFGHLTGGLAWMENKGNGKYEHHTLLAEPGVLKTYVEDVNHDGLQDVWALFSQGNEGIHLFTNKGNGQFDQQAVLRFPALYGSTYFEFADINNDGKKDIIYTCGDNADYSLVLKPYHGVYIYLNEGGNRFKQAYFFPINGCYKAMARDYDSDGDLDIATIAFFADYAGSPEEGFVYLQNEGGLQFSPHTLPATNAGRWLTMDAGDLDGDGKPDIVLGNFSIRPTTVKPKLDWTQGPPFMVLKNIHK